MVNCANRESIGRESKYLSDHAGRHVIKQFAAFDSTFNIVDFRRSAFDQDSHMTWYVHGRVYGSDEKAKRQVTTPRSRCKTSGSVMISDQSRCTYMGRCRTNKHTACRRLHPLNGKMTAAPPGKESRIRTANLPLATGKRWATPAMRADSADTGKRHTE